MTGLEQYSFEKAGYFIRRGFIDSDKLSALRNSLAAGESTGFKNSASQTMLESELKLAASVLGSAPLLAKRESLAEYARARAGAWNRACPVDWNEPAVTQIERLVRSAEQLIVRIPFASDDSLLVIAGTHVGPPDPISRAALDAGIALVPGSVSIRLAPGDALVMNPNVIHCARPAASAGFCDTFVTQRDIKSAGMRKDY